MSIKRKEAGFAKRRGLFIIIEGPNKGHLRCEVYETRSYLRIFNRRKKEPRFLQKSLST